MKPLSATGYLRYPSLTDFPGCIAAVLFFPFCNFSCGYCHNRISFRSPGKGLSREQLEAVLDDQMRRHWITGVVLSGGEASVCTDLREIITIIKAKGLSVKLDTNGSKPDALASVIESVDYIAMDVKSEFSAYGDVAGFDDTESIAESIQLISQHAADYEFRTTVIPGIHTPESIQALTGMIRGARRYILQRFIPRDDLPDPAYRDRGQTPFRLLEDCRKSAAGNIKEVAVR